MRRFLPWIIWGLGSLYFFAEYFVRVSTGALSPILMNELHIQAVMVGSLSAFFYYAYIGMQIPVGILVDKFGAKLLLVASTLIFGVACFLFSFIHEIWLGCLYRFIMGLTGAFAFVGTLKLITIYFEPRQFAVLAGITQGLGMLGAVIGEAPISYMFSIFGWRITMFYISFIFIALSLNLLFLVRETKTTTKSTNQPHQINKPKSSLWTDIQLLFASKGLWLNCLFIGLLYAPTTTFGEQWGALFMSSTLSSSITAGAFAVGFIFIAMAIGCPLIGFISDRIKSRIKVMRFCSVACLCLILVIIYPHWFGFAPSTNMYYALMFLYGIFNSAIVVSYALSSELIEHKISGLALGVTNMASVIIGSLFIPLIGFIIDKMHPLHCLTHVQLSTFHTAFIMFPACFIICFILTYFITDTKCRNIATKIAS